jgi:hypothetical protein
MFQLVSLTAKTAKVSVVGGSYEGGSQTLTIRVGQPVTLQNTADGTRYTIELLPQGTSVPSGGSAAAGSAAPTTTAPATTTTPTGTATTP